MTASLACLIVGAFIGSLIAYLLMRSELDYVREEAAESRYMHDCAVKELEIALRITDDHEREARRIQ